MKKFLTIGTALSLIAVSAIAADKSSGDLKNKEERYNRRLDSMMSRLDTNQDKAISKEEFLAAQEKKFSLKDTNQDGKITKEEMIAARKAKIGEHGRHHGNAAQKEAGKAADAVKNPETKVQ